MPGPPREPWWAPTAHERSDPLPGAAAVPAEPMGNARRTHGQHQQLQLLLSPTVGTTAREPAHLVGDGFVVDEVSEGNGGRPGVVLVVDAGAGGLLFLPPGDGQFVPVGEGGARPCPRATPKGWDPGLAAAPVPRGLCCPWEAQLGASPPACARSNSNNLPHPFHPGREPKLRLNEAFSQKASCPHVEMSRPGGSSTAPGAPLPPQGKTRAIAGN